MRQEDSVAAAARRDPGKKCIACDPCRGLDGKLLARSQVTNAGRPDFAKQFVLLRQVRNEEGVGASDPPTQSMLQMANDQPAITAFSQPLEQRDRIAAPGDADQISPIRRKGVERHLEGTVGWTGLPHWFCNCRGASAKRPVRKPTPTFKRRPTSDASPKSSASCRGASAKRAVRKPAPSFKRRPTPVASPQTGASQKRLYIIKCIHVAFDNE